VHRGHAEVGQVGERDLPQLDRLGCGSGEAGLGGVGQQHPSEHALDPAGVHADAVEQVASLVVGQLLPVPLVGVGEADDHREGGAELVGELVVSSLLACSWSWSCCSLGVARSCRAGR
jgi:hypothetical protein